MKFELKTKELVEIDKKIFELNKFYGLAINSLNRFPNVYTVGEFSKHSAALIKDLKSVKTEDEFEKLFIENSLYNLEAQEAYLNYFSKGDLKVEKMAEIVLGKDALKILKENIKNFSYEKLWDFYLSYQDYSYKSIPVDDESLRDEFKKILVNLKKDFLNYCKKEYGIPKDYDFELVLGQPYSENTFFHPTNQRMEVSPVSFFVFKDEGKVKINVTDVIRLLFHEILGHGRHEILSREMPFSMQDNSINTAIPSLHVHFEGVSQTAELEAVKFMEVFKKKYGIEDDYIKQRILSRAMMETANFQALYKYLGLKKIEDNSFDKDEEFKKITGNHGLSVLYSSGINSSLGFVSDAVYPLGLFYLNKILDDLKKKLGEKVFEENYVEIYNAIATGVFNFKTLPKFIDLYLKERRVLNKK